MEAQMVGGFSIKLETNALIKKNPYIVKNVIINNGNTGSHSSFCDLFMAFQQTQSKNPPLEYELRRFSVCVFPRFIKSVTE